MDKQSRDFILEILDKARDLTIATNRADGWPQATTASFVHDGLIIYLGVGPEGQKAKNIARDPRVSVVVDVPYRAWSEIKGLSMAAEAAFVTDAKEKAHIGELMTKRFGADLKDLPPIEDAGFAFVRIRPKIVSMLDYSKGFGHTEQIDVANTD